MTLIKSRLWPHPPDPREGHFCSRGFQPCVAGPWRWTLSCPTASGFVAGLVSGITLGFDGIYAGDYLFSAITEADPFGLFNNFWSLTIHTLNPPDAIALGYSVEFLFIVVTTPGIYIAAIDTSFLWPSNRSPFNLGVPTQSPFGVDLFGGDLILTPVEFDTPTGPLAYP